MGVSINGGTPNGWFILENRIKMDGLGVALFQEPLYDMGIHRQWLCLKTSVELGVAKSIYSLWSSFGHGFIPGTGWGGGWDADSPFMVPWGKMKGTWTTGWLEGCLIFRQNVLTILAAAKILHNAPAARMHMMPEDAQGVTMGAVFGSPTVLPWTLDPSLP